MRSITCISLTCALLLVACETTQEQDTTDTDRVEPAGMEDTLGVEDTLDILPPEEEPDFGVQDTLIEEEPDFGPPDTTLIPPGGDIPPEGGIPPEDGR